MSYPSTEPIEATVEQLRPRMKNLTVTFKLVEIGEPRDVKSRADGEEHRIADAVVGDSTGVVVMPLWDQSIDEMQVGQTYVLKNGYTTLFKGYLRLNIGRYGEVSGSETPIEEVNMENNMSDEYHEYRRPRRFSSDRRGRYGRNDRRDRSRRY